MVIPMSLIFIVILILIPSIIVIMITIGSQDKARCTSVRAVASEGVVAERMLGRFLPSILISIRPISWHERLD